MGEVYKAKETRLGRTVAVKVLPQSVATGPDTLARSEAKLVAEVYCPLSPAPAESAPVPKIWGSLESYPRRVPRPALEGGGHG